MLSQEGISTYVLSESRRAVIIDNRPNEEDLQELKNNNIFVDFESVQNKWKTLSQQKWPIAGSKKKGLPSSAIKISCSFLRIEREKMKKM